MVGERDAHVVMLPDGHYTMHCRHCGESYTPTLPIGVGMFVALTREFLKAHRRCKPQPEASRALRAPPKWPR